MAALRLFRIPFFAALLIAVSGTNAITPCNLRTDIALLDSSRFDPNRIRHLESRFDDARFQTEFVKSAG